MTSVLAGKYAFPLRRKPRRSMILVSFLGTRERIGSAARRQCCLQKPDHLVGPPCGERHIAHGTSSLGTRDDNSRVLKEIERRTISAAHKHEMNPCPALTRESLFSIVNSQEMGVFP